MKFPKKNEFSKATICCFYFKQDLKPNYIHETKNVEPNKKSDKNANSVYGMNVCLGARHKGHISRSIYIYIYENLKVIPLDFKIDFQE